MSKCQALLLSPSSQYPEPENFRGGVCVGIPSMVSLLSELKQNLLSTNYLWWKHQEFTGPKAQELNKRALHWARSPHCSFALWFWFCLLSKSIVALPYDYLPFARPHGHFIGRICSPVPSKDSRPFTILDTGARQPEVVTWLSVTRLGQSGAGLSLH